MSDGPCRFPGVSAATLLRERSPVEEAEFVAHLDSCSSCSSGVQAAIADASLRNALRGLGPDGPLACYLKRVSAAETAPADGDSVPVETAPFESDDFSFLAPAENPDELGRLGEYRVLELVGRGGMGMVFRAEDCKLKRTVALKVMRPEAAAAARSTERFLREARTMAALDHDHVVAVHHVGEDRGVPFLAMPFLQGTSLNAYRRNERPLDERLALRIGREVASGLAAAHRAGLIHRDIKPANIWIDSAHGERAMVLDFGLARGEVEDVAITRLGTVLGTPAYMAPEQAAGTTVDGRADLFSLGVVLYELVTGRRPFDGDNAIAILNSLANQRPTPPRDRNPTVSPSTSDLILGLLEKDPARRPASAEIVERELVERLAGIAAPARSRRRTATVAVLALFVAGGVAVAAYWARTPDPEPQLEPAANAIAPPTPEPKRDLQREAAEWVQRCGGWVMLAGKTPGDPAKTISSHEPLPEGSIEVVGLGFNRRPVRDDELQTIRPLKSLSLIDLEGTGIGDEGLKPIFGLKGVWRIGLADTKVTDASIEGLATMTGLRAVNADRSGMTVAGFERLRSRLPADSLSLPKLDGPEGDLRVANWLAEQRGSWTTMMFSLIDSGPTHFLYGSASFAGMSAKNQIPMKPWRMTAIVLGIDTKDVDAKRLEDLKALEYLGEVDVRRSLLNEERIAALRAALPRCSIVTNGGTLPPSSK